MSRKHFPAAVLVSIGCSVAFSAAPRARTVRTRDVEAAVVVRRGRWALAILLPHNNAIGIVSELTLLQVKHQLTEPHPQRVLPILRQ
jgi:hypothetical protein